MYDQILVPTDGSRSAEAAARHGLLIAEAFDVSVHIISVTDDKKHNVRLVEA